MADRENGENLFYDFIRLFRFLSHVVGMADVWLFRDFHVLCYVVKLCYIRDIAQWIFRQTYSNGQIDFWPNVSNSTKWVVATDINDSNWHVVIVTAIHFESSSNELKRLSIMIILIITIHQSYLQQTCYWHYNIYHNPEIIGIHCYRLPPIVDVSFVWSHTKEMLCTLNHSMT